MGFDQQLISHLQGADLPTDGWQVEAVWSAHKQRIVPRFKHCLHAPRGTESVREAAWRVRARLRPPEPPAVLAQKAEEVGAWQGVVWCVSCVGSGTCMFRCQQPASPVHCLECCLPTGHGAELAAIVCQSWHCLTMHADTSASSAVLPPLCMQAQGQAAAEVGGGASDTWAASRWLGGSPFLHPTWSEEAHRVHPP